MSDLLDCGLVKVIALKKCGSSQLRKAFSEKVWDKRAYWWGVNQQIRYVTFVRHPASRLWSCWHHLVRRRVDIVEQGESVFGPGLPFCDWLDWVFNSELSVLDHHIRPQAMELRDYADNINQTSKLFIGSLESSQDVLVPLVSYLGGRSINFKRPNREPVPHWLQSIPSSLVKEIRNKFSMDMRLWWSIHSSGYQIVGNNGLSNQLDNII